MEAIKFIHLSLFICISIQLIECNVLVKTSANKTVDLFHDYPAEFGSDLPLNGLKVYAVRANPIDGCNLQTPFPNKTSKMKMVLIMSRNVCSFEQKVRNAQNASYDAAIVFNVGSDSLEHMSSKDGAPDITIPSVFIGETNGRYIINGYLHDTDFHLVIDGELPFNINLNLIVPFSILMGFTFISMILYVIYKCIIERRRLGLNRLPKRLLKQIPIVKFVETHPYDTCVICLEDYTKGERLRVLPCLHAYHCHCIDPWLTKNRRNCPICKRKVFIRPNKATQRSVTASDGTSESDDDTQPLLNTYNNGAGNHGTFMSTHRIRDLEQQVTDDENILGGANSTTATSQRPNPFDRPNTENRSLNTSRSFWNHPIFSIFTRRSVSAPLLNDIINSTLDVTINPNEIRVTVPRNTSNNILNTNLSGSFKESDDDDEYLIAPTTIYEPVLPSTSMQQQTSNPTNTTNKTNNNKRKRTRAGAGAGAGAGAASSSASSSSRAIRNSNNNNNQSDVFVQTPSQGAIGVAALPNTNLRDNNTRKFGQRSSFNI